MRYRTIVADPPWEIPLFTEWGAQRGSRDMPYRTMSEAEIAKLPVGSLVAPEAHLYLWTTAGHLRATYGIAEAWGFEPMYPLVWCKERRGDGPGGKFASNVEFILFCRERHGAVAITSYLADAALAAGLTSRDVNRAMGTSDMAGWWLSRLPHRSRIPTVEQWWQLKSLLGFDDRYDEDVAAVNQHRGDGLRCDTRWWRWPRGVHSAKPEAFLDVVESVSPSPRLEMFARRARFGWDYWGDESLGTAEVVA